MKEFAEDLLNGICEGLSNLLEGIFDFIFGDKLREILLALCNDGIETYNEFIDDAIAVLTQDPTQIAGGALWNVIAPINTALVAVGSALVVLFFLIDFCSSSLDVKDNVRMETVFKTSIKLVIAEYFVANNLTIVKGLIAIGSGIVKIIGGASGSNVHLKLPNGFVKSVDKYNVITVLIGVIVWFIIWFVLVGCGVIIMYLAYQRAIKLLVIVPFGAIAFSTIAGGHHVNHTVISFVKYLFATLLEAGAIIIVLVLMGKLISSGGISAISTTGATFDSNLTGSLKAGLSIALSALLTVGIVKGCLGTIERGLGL